MTTTPPREATRVRPLWERDLLFREPVYDPSIAPALEDDDEGENVPPSEG